MAEKHITGLGRSFNYCFGWKSNPSRFVFFISVNSTQYLSYQKHQLCIWLQWNGNA